MPAIAMLVWISFALLALIATACLVWPLVRARPDRTGPDDELQRRLAVFRDRRDEITREREAGRLSAVDAQQAQTDLLRQLADEMPDTDVAAAAAEPAAARAGSTAARTGATLAAALAVAVLVPALTFVVYRSVGAPELAVAQLEGRMPPAGLPHERFDTLVAQIEARLQADPNDGEAWAILAEANRLAERHDKALPAYARAVQLLPPNARLLADYAESMAISAGETFEGEPTALLERAYGIDPNDQKVVALLGAASFRAGNLPRAKTMLEKLLASMPPDTEDAGQIREIIRGIERQIASRPAGAADPAASAATQPAAAAAIRGTVSLAPELSEREPASATLFVVARAVDGPRIPVAALRVPAAKLPFTFKLDDSNAMDPSRKPSTAGPLMIEARLSASGEAIRRPGDLIAEAVQVPVGADDVQLRIDQVVQ